MCVCEYNIFIGCSWVDVLTACFYGNALEFAKKASLNMETETIDSEGNSVRQTGRQLCKQLSHSHTPNFIDSLSMHKIQIHHCTYLEKCGSRLEFQCQWFLWHISIESSVLVVAVVEVIIVVVGGDGSDGKSECGLIIVYVIQLLFSVAIALKSNFPTSQK